MWWVHCNSALTLLTTSQTNILCPRLNSFSITFVEVKRLSFKVQSNSISVQMADAEENRRLGYIFHWGEKDLRCNDESFHWICEESVTRWQGAPVMGCSVTYSGVMRYATEPVRTNISDKLAKTWLNQIKESCPVARIFAVYLTVYLRFIGA